MKFNASWFYDEFKEALRSLGLGWGDHAKVLITTDEKKGTLTFSGNGRSLTITVCPE